MKDHVLCSDNAVFATNGGIAKSIDQAVFALTLTNVFGTLVGQAQKLRYDEELFFLAAVLHGLGLTWQFRGLERFEVVGADAADAFLKDQGVNPERRGIIWDAIAPHTSIGIASRKCPEIALLHIGAGVDVIGRGLDNLPKNLVAETIEALPRHDFNNAFFNVLLDTIAHAPQSAAMTWTAQTANAHVPGCPCPSLESQLKPVLLKNASRLHKSVRILSPVGSVRCLRATSASFEKASRAMRALSRPPCSLKSGQGI
jgi:hypothetical protein